jgi:hypothetical protein
MTALVENCSVVEDFMKKSGEVSFFAISVQGKRPKRVVPCM